MTASTPQPPSGELLHQLCENAVVDYQVAMVGPRMVSGLPEYSTMGADERASWQYYVQDIVAGKFQPPANSNAEQLRAWQVVSDGVWSTLAAECPSAPSEPPAAAQQDRSCPHCGGYGHGGPNAYCAYERRSAPPADAPEQQDDAHTYKVRNLPDDAVGTATVWRDREPWLRGIVWEDAELIVAALASRRPAEADQQRREQIARWEFARHAPGRYWGSGALPDAEAAAYEAADELLSLLSAPAGPADQDGEQPDPGPQCPSYSNGADGWRCEHRDGHTDTSEDQHRNGDVVWGGGGRG